MLCRFVPVLAKVPPPFGNLLICPRPECRPVSGPPCAEADGRVIHVWDGSELPAAKRRSRRARRRVVPLEDLAPPRWRADVASPAGAFGAGPPFMATSGSLTAPYRMASKPPALIAYLEADSSPPRTGGRRRHARRHDSRKSPLPALPLRATDRPTWPMARRRRWSRRTVSRGPRRSTRPCPGSGSLTFQPGTFTPLARSLQIGEISCRVFAPQEDWADACHGRTVRDIGLAETGHCGGCRPRIRRCPVKIRICGPGRVLVDHTPNLGARETGRHRA